MEILQVLKKCDAHNIYGYLVRQDDGSLGIYSKRETIDMVRKGVISNASLQFYGSSTIIRLRTAKSHLITGAPLVMALKRLKFPVGIKIGNMDMNGNPQMQQYVYVGEGNNGFGFIGGDPIKPTSATPDYLVLNTGKVVASFDNNDLDKVNDIKRCANAQGMHM